MGTESFEHQTELRVRYSETDQMGTFYNSRALEWFEVARTELLRAAGACYADMERRGALLPLVEAYAKFQGRARYDDLLTMRTRAALSGKASIRFEYVIVHKASGAPVASGHTVHAVADESGKPIRAPVWLVQALSGTAGNNR